MLLAVDAGNTNISFGVLDGRKLRHHLRSESARQRTPDEYAILVREMMSLYGIDAASIDAAIIASVVPALTDRRCFSPSAPSSSARWATPAYTEPISN